METPRFAIRRPSRFHPLMWIPLSLIPLFILAVVIFVFFFQSHSVRRAAPVQTPERAKPAVLSAPITPVPFAVPTSPNVPIAVDAGKGPGNEPAPTKHTRPKNTKKKTRPSTHQLKRKAGSIMNQKEIDKLLGL